MPDAFLDRSDSVSAPARRMVALTPTDGADLADVPKAIYVGTGGDINMIAAGDTAAVPLKNVPTGTILPVRAKRILATSTTASNLVALY